MLSWSIIAYITALQEPEPETDKPEAEKNADDKEDDKE